MTFSKTLMSATAAAALMAGTAWADLPGVDREQGYEGFHTGFMDTGYYSGWDSNNDNMLAENEFATGVYADWDTDNDLRITEDEYAMGAERWYGTDYDVTYDTWDADSSGYIDQNEFGTNWNSDYYANWDANSDGMLDENEYSTGVYNTADLDGDEYIAVEEEGWFEGWFDGDDVEAEIREVGDVM
jgi:hypothetical protein